MSKISSETKVKKASRKEIISRIENTACSILKLWKEVIDQAEKHEPNPAKRCWFKHNQRQAYEDFMIALEQNNLIDDYNITNQTITLAKDI